MLRSVLAFLFAVTVCVAAASVEPAAAGGAVGCVGRGSRNMPPSPRVGDLRMPQCSCVATAQNLRGAMFQGHGPTPERAFDEAMAKCSASSWVTCTCRLISIRAEPLPCAMDPQTQANRSANIAQEYWRFTIPVP